MVVVGGLGGVFVGGSASPVQYGASTKRNPATCANVFMILYSKTVRHSEENSFI